MSSPSSIDGILVQWGDRLFYPDNLIVKTLPQPRLCDRGSSRAAELRARIADRSVQLDGNGDETERDGAFPKRSSHVGRLCKPDASRARRG